MKRCHQCGHPWASGKKQPSPKDFCEQCSAYLHSCLNCRYHEPGRHNECVIPNTDWVGDRAGGNFCDEFEFCDAIERGEETVGDRGRQTLEGLFGESEEPSAEDRLRRLREL